MVALHAVVRVLLGVVNRIWDQLVDDSKQRRSQIGGDLTWSPMGNQCSFKEGCSRRDVSTFRHVYVDDLAMLIYSAVDVTPDTGNLDVGLVHKPPIADTVTTRPSRVDQQRREALNPSVDRDVVDFDPTFGQQLLDVSIRQSVAEIPADRQQDHLRREPIANKGRGLSLVVTIRPHTIAG